MLMVSEVEEPGEVFAPLMWDDVEDSAGQDGKVFILTSDMSLPLLC
jgi:hypothetical protein